MNGYYPGESNEEIVGIGADPDSDGVANGLELVLGGDPKSVMNAELLPTIALVTNPGGGVPDGEYVRFTYRRAQAAVDAGLQIGVQCAVTFLSLRQIRFLGAYEHMADPADSFGSSWKYRYVFCGTGQGTLEEYQGPGGLLDISFPLYKKKNQTPFTYTTANGTDEVHLSESQVEHYQWTRGKLTQSPSDIPYWRRDKTKTLIKD